MPTARLASVALLAIRTQRIALCLAPPSRWQDLYGLGTARLELPGAAHALSADPLAEALALAPSVLGCPAAPLPTRWTYGPSPRHAVDRVAADDPATAPMLRFERMLPREARAADEGASDAAPLPELIAIEVYRAALDGVIHLDPQMVGALIWAPVEALRALTPGMRLGEARALGGVEVEAAPATPLPDDLLLYLPSDYGERHLTRLAAKYGAGALFTAP